MAAASVAVENGDDAEEEAAERNAKRRRENMWVVLQAQTHLSNEQQRELLRAMAMKFAGRDPIHANNLLLACITSDQRCIRETVSPWAPWGGRISSVGARGCDLTDVHFQRAMAECHRLWDVYEGRFFRAWVPEHVERIHWGIVSRMFDFDDCLMLEQKNTIFYRRDEVADFIDLACLHRVLVAHAIKVSCCPALDVRKACVYKQTSESGCLAPHYGSGTAENLLIALLGTWDKTNEVWLTREGKMVPGGVNVYPASYGTREDDPMALPIRYDLKLQGDAMILRHRRYKSETVPPPPGYDVYKYVIWFNAEEDARRY